MGDEAGVAQVEQRHVAVNDDLIHGTISMS
jgi:hypothetical protein